MFDRRQLLKSASLGASAVLLSPILRQVQLHAAGEVKLPKRFVFVLQNNGFLPHTAQPKGIERTSAGPDRLTDVAIGDHELPIGMEPLEPYKKLITIIQRLNGRHVNPWHGGGYGALSGSREARRVPLAQTIDAALARAFPAIFPVVGLGLDARPVSDSARYVCSAWGPSQPIVTQCRPDLAFNSLFGSVSEKGQQNFLARTKLLDFMRDDVSRVRAQLSTSERERFDYYVNSYETLGNRLVRLQEMEDQLRKHAPPLTDKYLSSNETLRLEAQFELAAAALIAGLTNVVTLCSGVCDPNGIFSGLGINITNHQIAHNETDNGRPAEELRHIIRRLHITHVAELIRKLSAVPEGDGTMMDNTLIVFTSDSAYAHHSDGKEWPFYLIGSLGNRLRTGRLLEFPAYGQPGNRTINALYCTLMHAAGHGRDHFNLDGGLRDIERPGPIEELLA